MHSNQLSGLYRYNSVTFRRYTVPHFRLQKVLCQIEIISANLFRNFLWLLHYTKLYLSNELECICTPHRNQFAVPFSWIEHILTIRSWFLVCIIITVGCYSFSASQVLFLCSLTTSISRSLSALCGFVFFLFCFQKLISACDDCSIPKNVG